MKLLYKNEAICIVKINADAVYYGNGKDLNSFGISALQFLRFNPYMDYVESEDLPIPRDIEEYIKKQAEERAKAQDNGSDNQQNQDQN